MPNVKMYTTSFCPYCYKAKSILDRLRIEFEEINIQGNPAMRDEIEKLTGRRDVPQVFIDDQHIGDDDDLAELAESGKLNEIFNIEGSTDDSDKKRRRWFGRA